MNPIKEMHFEQFSIASAYLNHVNGEELENTAQIYGPRKGKQAKIGNIVRVEVESGFLSPRVLALAGHTASDDPETVVLWTNRTPYVGLAVVSPSKDKFGNLREATYYYPLAKLTEFFVSPPEYKKGTYFTYVFEAEYCDDIGGFARYINSTKLLPHNTDHALNENE